MRCALGIHRLGDAYALQDSIALFEAYRTTQGKVPQMLEEFRRIRRPGSDSLQQAAVKSTEWYENLGPKLELDPVSFAYGYLRRNGQVSHSDIQQRCYVYAEGRRKDLINRGGEKISCDEVENLIFGLSQVKHVSVVAMADPVFGEKACACVVLRPGTELTFDDLILHLRSQKIASFKLPERLEVMESFPMGPVERF